MAFEIPGFKFGTQRAAANLTAGRFVTINTSGLVAQVGTAGARAEGVTDSAAASGEAAAVTCSGVVKVVAGAAISQPGPVTTDNQGRAIPASTTGHHILGTVLDTAGAAGEMVSVNLGYKGVV